MEGSYWKALKVIIFLQEQTGEMDLCLNHFIYFSFLFLSVETFGLPPLTLLEEIILNTDVRCSLLSVSDTPLSISWLLIICCL